MTAAKGSDNGRDTEKPPNDRVLLQQSAPTFVDRREGNIYKLICRTQQPNPCLCLCGEKGDQHVRALEGAIFGPNRAALLLCFFTLLYTARDLMLSL